MNTPVFDQRIASGWAWSLAAVFFSVPLAVDLSGLWAFLPVKEAILVGGAGVVLLLAAVSWAAAGPRPRTGRSIDRTSLLFAGGTVAWLVAAPAIAASNPHLHLLGAIKLLATAGLGGLTALAVLRGGDRWRVRFFGAFAAAGGLIAVIAILQAVGADPIEVIAGGPLRAEGRWRVVATLGNPTWTGEYLAAVLPITLFTLRRSLRGKWAPSLEAVVAVTFASAVVATGSRLAMVSLAVGLGAWLVADERSALSIRGRIWSIAGAAIVAVLAIAGAAASSDAVRERMLHVESIRGRVGLAGASVLLVIRNPVAGHGLDHYRVVLPDGLRSFSEQLGEAALPYMPRTLVDHADSDLLELAVEGGVPAAILMLAIWILGLHRAFSSGPAEDRKTRLAMGCSLLALAVSSLASSPLHTPATALLFWVPVGLLIAGPGPSEEGARVRSSASRAVVRRVVAVVTLAVALAAVRYATALVTGNRWARAAKTDAVNDMYGSAEEIYREILLRAPWDGESRLHLGGLLIARSDYEEGLAMVRSSRRWSASQRAWLLEARALAATGRLQEGIEVLEPAVAALPEGRAMLVELGELYLAAGRREDAADAFRRALSSRQRAPNAEVLDRRAREGLDRGNQ